MQCNWVGRVHHLRRLLWTDGDPRKGKVLGYISRTLKIIDTEHEQQRPDASSECYSASVVMGHCDLLNIPHVLHKHGYYYSPLLGM